MKRTLSMVCMIVILIVISAMPIEAAEAIKYQTLGINELAYCNLDEAPEEWQDDILQAREEIIYSQSWTVDGACVIQNEDGTIEELPEFSELFPEWDVPQKDTSSVAMARTANYVGYVYLQNPCICCSIESN